MAEPSRPATLVIACGALVRELRTVLDQLPGPPPTVVYLPANLHSTPSAIPAAVAAVAAEHPEAHIVAAYADCGTGGRLDRELERLGATRLPGAHCYEFFAGADRFAAWHDAEPGTFYLTDFLARHFDALVIGTLGLDRHPELRDQYFAHYRRLVLISQSGNSEVRALGRAAAERLGLEFIDEPVGLAPFSATMRAALGQPAAV